MDTFYLKVSLAIGFWITIVTLATLYWPIRAATHPAKSKVLCGVCICICTALSLPYITSAKSDILVELAQQNQRIMLNYLPSDDDSIERKEQKERSLSVRTIQHQTEMIKMDNAVTPLVTLITLIISILGSCIGGALIGAGVLQRFDDRLAETQNKPFI